MKFFVTGATGFIGGELVRQLRRRGDSVVALVRDPARAFELVELGCDLAEGDITERATLAAPMTGVDGVFHLAAWYKVGSNDPSVAETINVNGTRNVLEVMRELAIPKGVYTSTLAVFSDTHSVIHDETYLYRGSHISEYDRTKWIAHYEVALPMIANSLPLIIVMPGAVYGTGDESPLGKTIDQYLRGKVPMVPKGSAFCWGHVEDIAGAHILAMDRGKPGETYIIAGPCHPLDEAFRLAERITGVRAPRLKAPPALLRLLSRFVRPFDRFLPEMYRSETLRVSAGVTYLGSNEKARRELGYQPRSLEEGFRFMFEKMGVARSEVPP